MTKLNYTGVMENVVTKEEFKPSRAKKALDGRKIAVLGHGPEAETRASKLSGEGLDVIRGVDATDKDNGEAISEKWVAGQNLFGLEEACGKADIIYSLLECGQQINKWGEITSRSAGKVLVFSDGMAVAYPEQTGITVPENADIILLAAKCRIPVYCGQGQTGFNASYAVYRDCTGTAGETALALGFSIGADYLFETDFHREVSAGMAGERGTLMGAIQGIFAAQYQVLRDNGHTPAEAFNATVDEFTRCLAPLVAEKGMDWVYENSGAEARRGALDWWKMFRNATLPVFKNLYSEVARGREAERVAYCTGGGVSSEKLKAELAEVNESEMWTTGRYLRDMKK